MGQERLETPRVVVPVLEELLYQRGGVFAEAVLVLDVWKFSWQYKLAVAVIMITTVVGIGYCGLLGGQEKVASDTCLQAFHRVNILEDVKRDPQTAPAATVFTGYPERHSPRMQMSHPAVKIGGAWFHLEVPDIITISRNSRGSAEEREFPTISLAAGLVAGLDELERQLCLDVLGLLGVVGTKIESRHPVSQSKHVGAVGKGMRECPAGAGESRDDVGTGFTVVYQERENCWMQNANDDRRLCRN